MADCSARLDTIPLHDTLPAFSARFADVEVKINAIILSLGGQIQDDAGQPMTCEENALLEAPTPMGEVSPMTVQPGPETVAGQPEEVTPPAASTSAERGDRLEEMAWRLARVETQLAGLPAAQAAVDALLFRFGALETTHVEPIRQAAQAEVRQMMEAERVAAEAAGALAPTAIEQLRLDLLAAVRTQGEDARRLQAILDSLGASIDKVGDRLTAIETGAAQDAQDRAGRLVAPIKAAPLRPADRNPRGLFSLDTFGLRRRGRIAFA